MAGVNAANRTASPPNGPDLKPIGNPPRGTPKRVRAFWRETVKLWPQLSQRDTHALGDYCRLMVDQQDLRKLVDEHGPFALNKAGTMVPSPPYTALRQVDRQLQTLRRDFAALAGYRERARAVSTPKAGEGDKPPDEIDGI